MVDKWGSSGILKGQIVFLKRTPAGELEVLSGGGFRS